MSEKKSSSPSMAERRRRRRDYYRSVASAVAATSPSSPSYSGRGPGMVAAAMAKTGAHSPSSSARTPPASNAASHGDSANGSRFGFGSGSTTPKSGSVTSATSKGAASTTTAVDPPQTQHRINVITSDGKGSDDKSEEGKGDENDLFMTPSEFDDILGVSPVNTFDGESISAFDSTIDAGLSRTYTDTSAFRQASPATAAGGINHRLHNEDAFSSSSSSDGGVGNFADRNDYESDGSDTLISNGGESDDEDYDSDAQPPPRTNKGKATFTSEFDKAAKFGKSSRGNFQLQDQESTVPATSTYHHHHVTVNTASASPPPPPASHPPKSAQLKSSSSVASSVTTNNTSAMHETSSVQQQSQASQNNTGASTNLADDPLSSGVLPDVLMTMRQKIESLTLFDSDMMKLAGTQGNGEADPILMETRESLKRSSQQSISAAVLVSLAHKRYERRRLAAMEIEKVVRSLAQQSELDRVRAILLLLSDDYVRSTSEDARKGGVVALAASAIGLKKAAESDPIAHECRDLILASVVHACQDHSQRVRYYATESLFNVVKVIPSLAIQHFFILFEILRSLYADVDVDVKSGAELLDKKLKEVIVGAMNSGSFTADACVPVFARFVYMRNKATKRLTLTWLQELAEKLIGAPILEYLHLFLGGIFDMVADPTLAIRQSALAFLQSVLPKLLVVNNHVVEEAIDDMEKEGMKVDFDKILQSLVTTMEHPDPFVRKVAMYWMSRIVKAHMGEGTAGGGGSGNGGNTTTKSPSTSSSGQKKKGNNSTSYSKNKQRKLSTQGLIMGKEAQDGHGHGDDGDNDDEHDDDFDTNDDDDEDDDTSPLSAATISVRNSLPHVLPGILLSIGDTFQPKSNVKDSFLPDQTTHALAAQTNACLQGAVRRDGRAYVQHLDSFIVALREELDSPGGLNARNPPALERKPYRMDVKHDGTGIESQGWFRGSDDTREADVDSMMMSRLCALHWVIVLYESVVPDVLKAEYAREFVIPIIHQLVDNPPEEIIYKSLETLAKITVPVDAEVPHHKHYSSGSLSGLSGSSPPWANSANGSPDEDDVFFPMTDSSVSFALDILGNSRRQRKSRDREVFSALIQLHAYNLHLIGDLSKVIAYMCRLQPPEFVFISFSVELERFIRRQFKIREEEEDGAGTLETEDGVDQLVQTAQNQPLSRDLQFVSSFIQQMCHVLLNAKEAKSLRSVLKDCIGHRQDASERDRRRSRLFHILLHSFSHNLVASTSLCLWGGAFRTASIFLRNIDPLDIHLMFLLELDKLVELIERPLFRHLHVRMLERDKEPLAEGSGTMLFQTLKSMLMLIPQSTCYNILRDRLVSTSRFRQSVMNVQYEEQDAVLGKLTESFVSRVLNVREMHCQALWKTIRAESLETTKLSEAKVMEDYTASQLENYQEGDNRREWLGYSSKEEERVAHARYREEKRRRQNTPLTIEDLRNVNYNDLESLTATGGDTEMKNYIPNKDQGEDSWKEYWAVQSSKPKS